MVGERAVPGGTRSFAAEWGNGEDGKLADAVKCLLKSLCSQKRDIRLLLEISENS